MQAYNELYDDDITSLQPNYLYVRFLPQSPADVRALLDTELEFWDFPLHRELISLGEKYHDPTVASPDFTWQYAVVPAGFDFPNVQYEILEPLALVPEDCKLAQTAFLLSQNEYEAPDEFVPDPKIKDGIIEYELPDRKKIEPADIPEALGPDSTLFNPTPCGCPLPDNVRKPSGCVTVEDNNLQIFDPVREVQVMASRSQLFGFIFHRSAYTNEKGCWQINHNYSGKIHVWVKFESATCNIKTMNGAIDLWGYTFPRKAYIGKYGGPNFNNIGISFNWTNNIDTKQFRNWVASTINNSIYETQRFNTFNGLPHPPGNLKILVTPWGNELNTGATPMLYKMSGWNQLAFATSNPLQLYLGLFGVIDQGISNLPSISLASLLALAAPDIVLNWNVTTNVNADDIREIAYHELAHAIHFTQVGDQYWLDEIGFTVANSGYGDGTSPGSGRAAVIEAWGWQTGMFMAHLRYGNMHSNGDLANTWQRRVERGVFVETYIPWGWQYDLLDDNSQNPTLTEPLGIDSIQIVDNITGFTRLEIFNTMTSNMLSIPQQKAALQSLLPAKGLSLGDYNTLSSSYGF